MARDPLKWPFSKDSIWNLPIGASAVYVNAQIAAASARASFPDVNVIFMDKNATPTDVFFNFDDWGGGTRCAVQGGVLFNAPFPASFIYEGNHSGNPDGDTPNASAAFLDADGNGLQQTQPFAHCSTTQPPTSHYMYGQGETLLGTGQTGSHGGSGLSALGGTIRLGELVPGGKIQHALTLNMDSVNFYPGFGGFRWPATKSDAGGAGYLGNVPECRMGSLLALRPSFNVASLLTEPGRIIGQAMQDYGGYICDSAGWSVYGVIIERSPNGSVRQEFLNAWGYGIDQAVGANNFALDMTTIFTNLYVVNNWDATVWASVSASNGAAGAGLGAPRVPWAPDFGVPPPPPPPPVGGPDNPEISLSRLSEFVLAGPPTIPTPPPSPVTQDNARLSLARIGAFRISNGIGGSSTIPAVGGGSISEIAGIITIPLSAGWLIEARPAHASPGGSWTTVPRFTGLNFKKTINDRWPLSFDAWNTGPQQGLRLFYDMEAIRSDGKMNDLSGNAQYGTITGTTDVVGRFGRGRYFSGATDSITTPFSTASINMSILAWVKWTTNPASDAFRVVEGRYTNIAGVQLSYFMNVVNNGTINAGFIQPDGNSVFVGNATTYNDGQWHHVAAILSNGTARLYIDGALVSTSISTITSVVAPTSLYIGQGVSAMTITVDDVYIYNKALSQNDVNALFVGGAGPLFQAGNEVRVRDTFTNKEWFRGRIREVSFDTIGLKYHVVAESTAVLLLDRTWQGRRTFPAVPVGVMLDELCSSTQGEPRNGQVLYYDMETLNSTGRLVDLSGNGNSGTLSLPYASVVGHWGLAYSFLRSQSNQFFGGSVLVADSPSLNLTGALTISAWIRPGADGGIYAILGKTNANVFPQPGYELVYANGKLWMYVGNGTTFQQPTTTNLGIPAGTWAHVAVTWDGNATFKFYLNGTLFQTIVTASQTLSTPSDILRVNGYPTTLTTPPFGFNTIDEVYLYNRALSGAEITLLAGVNIFSGGIGAVPALDIAVLRAENEKRLNILDEMCRTIGAEWYTSVNDNDQDVINVVSRIGSSVPKDTFTIGRDSSQTDRRVDSEQVINDMVVLGSGDGASQSSSRNFNATSMRTTLSTDLGISDTAISVVSTSGFPASGILFVGMERVKYTTMTAASFSGLSRAYVADSYASLSPYIHRAGMEVYLHADTTTSPAVYYSPHVPQAGSSADTNKWRQGSYADRTITDQNALDFLAFNLRDRYDQQRESFVLVATRDVINADLGDAVNAQFLSGTPYQNSPYRIWAAEFDYDSRTWKLELGANVAGVSSGFRDDVARTTSNIQDQVTHAGAYGQGYAVLKQITATVGTAQVAVPHGLGAVPNTVLIRPKTNATVWESAPADAANIYLTSSVSFATVVVSVG